MIDESICAIALTPSEETIKSSKNVMWTFLHTITESTYEQFKKGAGGKVDVALPIVDIPISFGLGANYDEFKESLRKLDEQVGATYSADEAMLVMKKITPPDGYKAFVDCLKITHLIQPPPLPVVPQNPPQLNNTGLVITVKPNLDPHLVSVSVFWGPVGTAPSDVAVVDSKVYIAGELQQYPLFPNGTLLYHNSWRHIMVHRKPGASVTVTVDINGEASEGSTATDNSGFFDAITRGDVALVEEYLLNGVSPDITDISSGGSAFYDAAASGKTAIVEAMRPYSPNVNFVWSPNNSAYTPLIAAAYSGWTDTVKALLTFPGLNKDAQDKSGQTALHWACRDDEDRAGNPLTVKALVDGGVNQSIQNRWGWTARRGVKDSLNPPLHRDEMLVYLAPQIDAP